MCQMQESKKLSFWFRVHTLITKIVIWELSCQCKVFRTFCFYFFIMWNTANPNDEKAANVNKTNCRLHDRVQFERQTRSVSGYNELIVVVTSIAALWSTCNLSLLLLSMLQFPFRLRSGKSGDLIAPYDKGGLAGL